MATNDPMFHTMMAQKLHCYICDGFVPRANMVAMRSTNGCKVICRSCQVNLNLEKMAEEAHAKYNAKHKRGKRKS